MRMRIRFLEFSLSGSFLTENLSLLLDPDHTLPCSPGEVGSASRVPSAAPYSVIRHTGFTRLCQHPAHEEPQAPEIPTRIGK